MDKISDTDERVPDLLSRACGYLSRVETRGKDDRERLVFAMQQINAALTALRAARLEAAFDPTAWVTDSTHVYRSTACGHQHHDRCRRVCKWCSAGCVCTCHREEERPWTRPASTNP